MKFKSIADLQSLIDNEIEESTELEYKSSFAMENPKWKEELAKDVSAMANANGGIIIYGIREKEGGNGHSVPSEVLPISYKDMSKDKLSQLLSSNIRPIVENVEITVVPFDDNSGCFIVEIPQSSTAHQNKLTHLYYIRRNATVEVMEDYEIRDVMNRSKHPVVGIEFELHKTTVHITEKPLRLLKYENWLVDDKKYDEIEFELQYRLVNRGVMFAKYINYNIYISAEIISDEEKEFGCIDDDTKYIVFSGNNTVRDLTAIKGFHQEYGPARYDPLLPCTKGKTKHIRLCVEEGEEDEENKILPPILYTVMADNAPVQKGKIEWRDIKIIEKTKSVTKDPNDIGFNIPSF